MFGSNSIPADADFPAFAEENIRSAFVGAFLSEYKATAGVTHWCFSWMA